MKSSLKLRLISGFTLGPLTLLIMWFGGLPFLTVIGLVFALAIYEFREMTKRSAHGLRDFLLGAFYLTICFVAFIVMRLGNDLGAFLVLALITTIWACDVGAYFSGKLIGGAKLAPLISPNKTWAGMVGGAIASGLLLSALFVGFMMYVYAAEEFNLVKNIPVLVNVFTMGALLAVIGQCGDLLVSWYKRSVGVKDTGDIIPGHGGILDRIDSLLLASPFFLLLLTFF